MTTVSVAERAGRAPARPHVELSIGQVLSGAALAVDAFLIVLVSVVTGTLFHLLAYGMIGDTAAFVAMGAISAVLFCGVVRVHGVQNRRADFSSAGRVRTAIIVWTIVFLFLVVVAFSLKVSSLFSRGAVFAFYFTGMATVAISRLMTPRVLARWSLTNAYRGVEIIIVAPAEDEQATKLRQTLVDQGCDYFRTVEYNGHFTDAASWMTERKRLVQSVFEAARAAQPGAIYVFGGTLPPWALNGFIAQLTLIPRAVYLVPNDHVSHLLQYEVKPVGRTPTIEMQRSPLSRFERIVKRLLDFAFAAVVLTVCAPLFAVIAIAIKLNSRGPVFFRQNRLGYRGHPFKIVKFRSMKVLEDGAEITQATRNDSRVTRIGGFLRKTSLDELPQLWNVLRGDMSVVGPRPHAIAHDKLYADLIENYEVRQHVKPGITGWAQVNGLRGETSNLDLMHRRIEMDIWYATNCGLLLDTLILVRTVFVVLRQRNAY